MPSNLVSVVPKVRYDQFRKMLTRIRQKHWFCYHKGNIAVAAGHSKEIALIRRITFGLGLSGKAILMQKRNDEGVMEYLLYPPDKLLLEDLEEAMALTSGRRDD